MLTQHATPVIAIATAPGRGAVGIVRLSGRGLQTFAGRLCRQTLAPRMATYLPLRDLQDQVIDRGLALFFPAPHSYTGEDVLELQVHGGPVVLQLLVAHCLALAGLRDDVTGQPLLPELRLARPGEFTERAFLNGKLDLAQAEAVADLIDASTEAAVRSASRSLSGVFSQQVQALRDGLVNLRMLVEATLDFPEEEIDFLTQADAAGKLSRLQAALSDLQHRTRQGALLREGIKVVIAGQPNAGKSSLLNALAGAELAIVTPIAGTTRDKVSQTIQIEGVPLHVVDTAGLRDSDDTVERIGIERAWDEIASADVVLFLHDLTRRDQADYAAEDARIAARLPAEVPRIDLWNKSDVHATPAGADSAGADDGDAAWPASSAVRAPDEAITNNNPSARAVLHLSAKTGHGLDALRRHLLQTVGWQSADEGIFMARERHVQALAAVAAHLDIAADHLAARAQSLDLLAEELRLAQQALNEITGEFTSDDLLGEIFSRFCIGK